MKELVNFEHFRIIKEAEARLEAHLDRVVEQAINEANPAQNQAGALFQNPVKFMKIKNNAKKYQQALVQKALNNVDYEKKKQAAGGEVDRDKLEVLRQANAAKNQALTDKASAISDRMTTLATSPGLQAVKSLAISKAKVAAAETALKAADAEETKRLKIQIKNLNAKAAEAEKAIKDYEKDEPKQENPQEAPQPQEAPKVKDDTKIKIKSEPDTKAIDDAKTAVDNAKAKYDQVKNGDDEGAKIDAEIAFKQAQQKKAKLEDNDELYQGLGNDIGELMTKKQELAKEPKSDETATDEVEIRRAEESLATHRKDVLDPLTDDLKKMKAESDPDEKELKKLEELVQKANLQDLRLQHTLAKAKGDEKEMETIKASIKEITDKLGTSEEAESTESGEEDEETSTEDKTPEFSSGVADNTGDEGNRDPIASLEKDIADFDKNIETEMATVAKLKKDLDQAKRDVSTGRGSDAEVLKIQKSLDDSNEDLAELKRRKADTKKKIDSLQKESVTYISESVADKFRHLMTERKNKSDVSGKKN